MLTQEVLTLIPNDFSDHSRVWIYQGSRPFITKEQKEIDEQLHQFYAQWQAHGEPVKGWAKLLFNQFIVVMADETGTNVTGCSTDGMVRVIKSLERQYEVNFFDRMTLTFLIAEKAEMLPFSQVQYALEKGYINEHTLTFNNIATTKKELLESWLVPLKESWLAARLNLSVAN
ncbi:MAG TPA: hypothetical protein PL009_12110 [Flavipsychrobacter sp.]|nr:hypothetical protein [Flavipsychrobacter sp.]